jgi:hypothetical protein
VRDLVPVDGPDGLAYVEPLHDHDVVPSERRPTAKRERP